MTCDDGFNPTNDPDHLTVQFKLEAILNESPVVTTYTGNGDDIDPLIKIEHVIVVPPQPVVFEIDISGMFTDPEFEELYYDVVIDSSTALDPSTTIAQV